MNDKKYPEVIDDVFDLFYGGVGRIIVAMTLMPQKELKGFHQLTMEILDEAFKKAIAAKEVRKNG